MRILCVSVALLAAGQSSPAQQWRRLTTSLAVDDFAVAYDSSRQRVLAFDRGFFAHEHDGTRWTPVPTIPGLAARPALAYQEHNGRMLACFVPVVAGARLETWEYDGATWVRRSPVHVPPALTASLAYDSLRACVVLVGVPFGAAPGTPLAAQTWEWNGSDWARRLPAISPPPNENAAIAFDPSRGVTVLFGGGRDGVVQQDHWEWDGATWVQRTPALLPDARSRAQLAWDSNRRRLMLWGGYPAPAPAVVFDARVWEFDGTDWSARTLATAPAGRSRHAMVQVRGGVRIFGGAGSPTLPALPWEIWDYDGARFTARHGEVLARTIAAHDAVRGTTIALAEILGSTALRTLEWRDSTLRELPVAPPPPRRFAQSVGAPLGGVLRIGGRDPAGPVTMDAWSFDGSAWRRLATNAPPPRLEFALALDPQRSRVVLFGGVDPAAGVLGDTWEFDGASWQQVPVAGPAARGFAAMAFDRTAGPCVLLCGGSRGLTAFDDTWRFDGVTWERTPATLPSLAASTVRLVHWPLRQQAVLVRSLPGGEQDAFVFGGSAWLPFAAPTTFGALAADERDRIVSLGADVEIATMHGGAATSPTPGCSNANTPARLVTHRLPRLGETAPVELVGARPRSIAFLALSPAWRPMQVPGGCFALDRPVLHAVVVTDAVGNAPLPLSFPADPALLFADIGAQVVVPEPAGPLFGSFALSQLLLLRAGD